MSDKSKMKGILDVNILEVKRNPDSDYTPGGRNRLYAWAVKVEGFSETAENHSMSETECKCKIGKGKYEFSQLLDKTTGEPWKIKIKPVMENKGFGGGFKFDPEEQIRINKDSATGSAIDTAKVFSWGQEKVGAITMKYLAYINEKGTNKQSAIRASSSIKRAVATAELHAKEVKNVIADEDGVLKQAQKYYDFWSK